MRFHRLKCWPAFFRAVRDGLRTCELRRADRDFRVDDVLLLEEFDPQKDAKTGEKIAVRITHILRSEDAPRGLLDGFVLLSVTTDPDAEDQISGRFRNILGPPEEVKP